MHEDFIRGVCTHLTRVWSRSTCEIQVNVPDSMKSSCQASRKQAVWAVVKPSRKPCRATERATSSRPASDTELRPRRPRPERLCRAPTTSTTRPRRNDDRHEERRYDNRDHRHNRPKSTRIRQLYRHRPDFYPKISTLLIFIFITTFLHNVLVMIILQITFVHVYHLKYNIQLYLMQILDQSC